MKIYDDYPPFAKPPYRKGQYIISLHRPVNWYQRLAIKKGKTYESTNIEHIIPMIVSKVFSESIDEKELYLFLNMDCIVHREAEETVEELIYLVQAELLGFFPTIGAELPPGTYWVSEDMELFINVPRTFEEQRGLFF